MTKRAKEIRAEARNALSGGPYWTYVGGYLLLGLTCSAMIIPLVLLLGAGIGVSGILPYFQPGGHPEIGLFTDPEVMLPLLASTLIFSLLILYPIGFLYWGNAAMAVATMRRGLIFGHAFSGWGHGWKMGWIVMVKGTYIFLWLLLLMIPGLVKVCAYAMTEYIAVDHPDWSATQCIAESRRMMDGHKWRYFCLNLSFAFWFILLFFASLLPMVGGLAQYFFMPYIQSAKAAFYEDLLDRDVLPDAEAGQDEVSDYVGLLDRKPVV